MKQMKSVALIALLLILLMGKSRAGFRCGKLAHNSTCPVGFCCSMSGYCGTTPEFCGKDRCHSQCTSSNNIGAIKSRKIPTDKLTTVKQFAP